MPVIGVAASSSTCTTLGDISARVLTLLGTDPQLTQAEVESMAIARYQLIHDTRPWANRRKEFRVNTVATISSSTSTTVTATLGSSTITSIGTPFTSTYDGYQIHLSGEAQYYFFTYVSTASGTLSDGNGNAVTWPHATNTATGWTLFKSLYTLPENCDTILSLGHDFPFREMDGGRESLDRLDPHRDTTSTVPTHWLYAGTKNCLRQIEVWPVPSAARTLSGLCLMAAAAPTADTTIDVHPSILTYGVAADCYNMLFAKTGDTGYQHLGLFYEKKHTEAVNDVTPWEVTKHSPPRSLGRRKIGYGRGTDWETAHDLDLLERGSL